MNIDTEFFGAALITDKTRTGHVSYRLELEQLKPNLVVTLIICVGAGHTSVISQSSNREEVSSFLTRPKLLL